VSIEYALEWLCDRGNAGTVRWRHPNRAARLWPSGRDFGVTRLAEAWQNHWQDVPSTLEAATQQVCQLLVRRPDLLISEKYSSVVTACDRCHERGSFRLARPEMIVATLGYR
jgi:hypothetical protein